MRRRKRPAPAGCGARQTESCPAPWPVAGAGDPDAKASGPQGSGVAQRGRLSCSLTIRLSVTLQQCGSGTIHLHERGPFGRESLQGGGRPRRETLRPPAPGPPRPTRTRPRPSPAGPRRRVGVVKSRRARGGCLGVISSGRGRLRYVRGSGPTRVDPGMPAKTRGTETSQYPEEQKATATPSVAASERGPA
jgi:hypothetical protein